MYKIVSVKMGFHKMDTMSPMLGLARPNADRTRDNDSRECWLHRPETSVIVNDFC
jgi:hypothetical protein